MPSGWTSASTPSPKRARPWASVRRGSADAALNFFFLADLAFAAGRVQGGG